MSVVLTLKRTAGKKSTPSRHCGSPKLLLLLFLSSFHSSLLLLLSWRKPRVIAGVHAHRNPDLLQSCTTGTGLMFQSINAFHGVKLLYSGVQRWIALLLLPEQSVRALWMPPVCSTPAVGASGVRGRRWRPAEPVRKERSISFLLDALSEISHASVAQRAALQPR